MMRTVTAALLAAFLLLGMAAGQTVVTGAGGGAAVGPVTFADGTVQNTATKTWSRTLAKLTGGRLTTDATNTQEADLLYTPSAEALVTGMTNCPSGVVKAFTSVGVANPGAEGVRLSESCAGDAPQWYSYNTGTILTGLSGGYGTVRVFRFAAGNYVALVHNIAGNRIDRAISADNGATWTITNTGVINIGGVGAWNHTYVWNTDFWCTSALHCEALYDGSLVHTWNVMHSVSADGGVTWTDDPLPMLTACSGGSATIVKDTTGLPVTVAGKKKIFFHNVPGPGCIATPTTEWPTTTIYAVTTTDYTPANTSAPVAVIQQSFRDEGVGSITNGQIADPRYVELQDAAGNKSSWMAFSVLTNGTASTGAKVKFLRSPLSAAQIVASTDGLASSGGSEISSLYIPAVWNGTFAQTLTPPEVNGTISLEGATAWIWPSSQGAGTNNTLSIGLNCGFFAGTSTETRWDTTQGCLYDYFQFGANGGNVRYIGYVNVGGTATNAIVITDPAGGAANNATVTIQGNLTVTGTSGNVSAASVTSATANASATGAVRLAKTDALKFRNNANGADLNGISLNTSDQAVIGDTAGVVMNGIVTAASNMVALTADWTCGTSGTVSSCTAATIIGSGGGVPLTFTLPTQALSWTFECNLVVGQATAATANQWNLLTATNGATNVTAYYQMGTAATATANGAVTDQVATTTTFQIAPSWTLGATGTKMPVRIWGRVEGASASGTVLSLQLLAPTVADLVTIYRGSSCHVR